MLVGETGAAAEVVELDAMDADAWWRSLFDPCLPSGACFEYISVAIANDIFITCMPKPVRFRKLW